MPPECPPIGATASPGRSRVTNARRLFLTGDGRTVTGRRLRDLVAKFAAPWGGLAAAGEPIQQLIRRAATLALQSERLEAEMAAGVLVDPVVYATLCNSFSRVLSRLEAIQPKPKQPTLAEEMAEARRERLAKEAAAA